MAVKLLLASLVAVAGFVVGPMVDAILQLRHGHRWDNNDADYAECSPGR